VARRRDQLDRGREMVPLSGLVDPGVILVDGLKIMDARVGEEGGMQRVIGVVMGNDDIGDRALRLAQAGKRAKDVVAMGDHAGIDDQANRAIAHIGDGRCDARAITTPADVASGQDVYLRRPRKLDALVVRAAQAVTPRLTGCYIRFWALSSAISRIILSSRSLIPV